jgi:hypothetical protein
MYGMSQLVIPTNASTTQLSLNITNVSTTLQVASTTGFAATGILTLRTTGNPEIVTYSAISGNTFTGLTRGTNGTTARSWGVGTNIFETEVMATEVEVDNRNLTIQFQEDGVDVSSKGGIDYVNFTGDVTAEELVAGTLIVDVSAVSNADAIAYAIALG